MTEPVDADPPETLLQFGGGNFLRAFVDLFLHEANTRGQQAGRAVVVTSTESPRAQWINGQRGCYHVAVRGLRDGAAIDETTAVIRALSRALPADKRWPQVLEVARSTDLRWIVSNTTEAGFRLDPADDADAGAAALGDAAELLSASCGWGDDPVAPRSFPAKLLAVLAARWHHKLPPVAVLPCELLEDNSRVLLRLLREQAAIWRLPGAVVDWIGQECPVTTTLVDRIVAGRPMSHPLLDQDRLLAATEPFASWIVEQRPGLELFEHEAIDVVEDVTPYALRKVRVLNGAHTALVCRAVPLELTTVAEAVAHPDLGPWLRRLLFEEVLPVLERQLPLPELEAFAESTLERFANPFLDHHLADIALHHETKVGTRLLPTHREYVERFGEPPPLLGEIVAPHL